jgi:glycosyltransferase involved in cell wall biosynthesis
MKIFYIAFSRIPTEKAHGLQIMKTCEALARSGATVELVVPTRKNHIHEDAFQYYDVEKNFILKYIPSIDWVPFGRAGFIASLIVFAEKVHFSKSFWSADVIYSRDALVLLQYLLLGRTLVYEAHTVPTFVSTFVARRVKHVIVISEGLKDAYVARGIEAKKITVAHDAVDLDFSKALSQRDARQKLGIPTEGSIAFYVGRIDAEKGVETLAAAAKLLPEGYSVVIVGEGPEKDRLVKKYPRAVFLPGTPYRDLPHILSAASVLVIPNSAKSVDASLYTSPLKAFAYLAAGIPIVASKVPALTSVLGDSAMYFQADDAVSLAEALQGPQSAPTQHPNTWDDRAAQILSVLK